MSTSQSVLILGAGLSSPPLSRYLQEHGFQVTIANRTLASAQKLATGSIKAIQLDIETPEGEALLDQIASQFAAIVSMLPYVFHPIAAKYAIKHKVHFFTTSYVSDAMREMNEDAKKAGIVLVNECGVDPGTDHMSAMRIIHAAKKNGGVIKSFTSYCGGLPAPQNNDNPFGYKLAWAPRGVLLASKNSAHFLKDGKEVLIPGSDLFDNYIVEEVEGLKVEGYPNRNSCQYAKIYEVEGIDTIIRGTYRYPGWCSTIKKIGDLGYLSTDVASFNGKTFEKVAAELVGSPNATGDSLRQALAAKIGVPADDRIVNNIAWLGLLDANRTVPESINTALDLLCSLAKEKWVYAPGEIDMLLMKHTFVIEYPDRTETVTSTMKNLGIPNGETSMMRTVSLPVAIAIRLVLTGKIQRTGIVIPTDPEIYNPILDELDTLGITFVDKVVKSVPK
eukprot:TRINITY_DN6362_c0_g1_i4.p1 TRINITY_DN6362_c0_g1~~TRINITY_DN6362_c0_g1_i4.p1  ORF type:complete len:448 (-),score=174.73 TRINITY_DN6362_c0_g1_i4:323-1666(-)